MTLRYINSRLTLTLILTLTLGLIGISPLNNSTTQRTNVGSFLTHRVLTQHVSGVGYANI